MPKPNKQRLIRALNRSIRHDAKDFWRVPKRQLLREEQQVKPKDPKTAIKIGISSTDRVLVFAGYVGDWARALAETNYVHYTDASPHTTKHVMKLNPGRIKRFTNIPAELNPQKTKAYDWSFSFEPWPLLNPRKTLEMVLLRALLNNKGAKIVMGGIYAMHNAGMFSVMKEVARTYDAKATQRISSITAEEERRLKKVDVMVNTLQTTTQAREKAATDLRILTILQKSQAEGKTITKSELQKRLKLPQKLIDEGLERLESLGLPSGF